MPFLNRSQIKQMVSQPPREEQKKAFREKLLDPSLSDLQRKQVSQRIKDIEEGREYSEETPTWPNAVDF